MLNALVFFAPLALLWPGSPGGDAAAHLLPEPVAAEQAASAPPAAGLTPGWFAAESLAEIPTQNQVRIEQRVTIRIAPLTNSPRRSMVPAAPSVNLRDYDERDAGKCIPLGAIRGVQSISDDRLLLYLRDRRVLSLRLRKSCRAQDFYSGFYVEPRPDGMLCVERDILRSRTGANCELREINRLVAND